MNNKKYFETGTFNPGKVWLSDEAYSQCTKAFVRGSVDVVPVKDGKMLLGKRTHHPQPDWWIFGGRWAPGLAPEVAICSKIQQELGLSVEPKRMRTLGAYSFCWGLVKPNPEALSAPERKGFEGCHDFSVVHILEVTEEEITSMLPNSEYSEIKWVSLEEVADPGSGYHSAIQEIATDIISAL